MRYVESSSTKTTVRYGLTENHRHSIPGNTSQWSADNECFLSRLFWYIERETIVDSNVALTVSMVSQENTAHDFQREEMQNVQLCCCIIYLVRGKSSLSLFCGMKEIYRLAADRDHESSIVCLCSRQQEVCCIRVLKPGDLWRYDNLCKFATVLVALATCPGVSIFWENKDTSNY